MSKIHNTKISVVGVGNVGATIAYALLTDGVAKEMALVDYNPDVAEGHAIDLTHARSFTGTMEVYSGDYECTKDSDVVVIAASIPSKNLKSRLDLYQGNVELFKGIIPKIVKFSPHAIILVTSNPLDIMTQAALKISGFHPSRVIGTGTTIDSERFRSLLAMDANIHPSNVHAYILGEHGDSQFPVLSLSNIGGVKVQPKDINHMKSIFENVRESAYKVIQKKGFTNFAIASATAKIVRSILRDQHKVFPISSLINNYYGESDICISVPTVLGKNGVVETLNIELNEEEQASFKKSAKVIRDIVSELKI